VSVKEIRGVPLGNDEITMLCYGREVTPGITEFFVRKEVS